MSIEEKYNKALNAAKDYLESGSYDAEFLKDIFPELRESEDERIRKELKGAFEVYDRDSTWNRIPIRSILAWLEKQKEQKPAWSEEDEKMSEGFMHKLEICDLLTNKEIEWAKHRLKSLRPQLRHRDTYYDIIHNILDSLKGIDFTQITPEHRVSLLNDIRVKCKNADECATILDAFEGKESRKDWKPSEDEERLINTSISFLKDFADKGYENAVECIDWLKSKLNGNTCE